MTQENQEQKKADTTINKEEQKEIRLRSMTMEDFDEVHALWMTIHGFGIRSVDDSYEGVERFLKRNPGCSVVATAGDEIVGAILCGHDGRTACLYHVCVREDYRKQGIGKAMVTFCMRALQKEHVSKISLVAFQSNAIGNHFWNAEGWTKRTDINQYEFILNESNIVRFNQ